MDREVNPAGALRPATPPASGSPAAAPTAPAAATPDAASRPTEPTGHPAPTSQNGPTSENASTAENDGAADNAGSADNAGRAENADATTADGRTDGGPGASPGGARLSRRVRLARRGTTVLRSVRAWTRRPTGRLLLPGLLLLTLVALTGAAGAYLVPAAVRTAATPPDPSPSQTPLENGLPAPSDLPGPGLPGSGPPGAGLPGSGLPGTAPAGGMVSTGPPVGTPGAPAAPGAGGGRPADALADWARQVGNRAGVPLVAMQAYGYAELVLTRTTPGCRLSWTTLAAIGRVESGHGSANGAVLGADGQAQPPIIGLPLDGQGGRQRIADTDRGQTDGDQQFDRAVGPMQFIPTTWAESGADADGDGVKDPNDIDDAALAAGNYLCKGNRDLSTSEDWWEAILSYNDVRRYAQDVFNFANDFGVRSRT